MRHAAGHRPDDPASWQNRGLQCCHTGMTVWRRLFVAPAWEPITDLGMVHSCPHTGFALPASAPPWPPAALLHLWTASRNRPTPARLRHNLLELFAQTGLVRLGAGAVASAALLRYAPGGVVVRPACLPCYLHRVKIPFRPDLLVEPIPTCVSARSIPRHHRQLDERHERELVNGAPAMRRTAHGRCILVHNWILVNENERLRGDV